MRPPHNAPEKNTSHEQIPFWAELSRKAVHLSSLLISAFVYLFGAKLALQILIPLSLLFFLGDILRAKSLFIRDLISRYLAFMMRDFELQQGKIVINGASWVLCGAVLSLCLFPERIAFAAFSILILGDAFAAIIGRRFGKTPLGKTGKSVEGTLAFIGFSFLVFPFVPELGFFSVLVSIVSGAIAEALPLPIDDNIRIPLVSGSVLWLLTQL